MKSVEIRDYQQAVLDKIQEKKSGRYLIAMGVGLGKTVVFTHLDRLGRVLIISHRDELVHQPLKYYPEGTCGVEMAGETSNGENVVSASILSLVRRLDQFKPDDFDTIIIDEAHHAAAASYKKVLQYFKPRLVLGFTATPRRGDKVRLDDVFDEILSDEYDMLWGIKNGQLADIRCLQVDIGYDISKVKRSMGDYNQEELAKAINYAKANEGVAKAYKELAVGRTLIFASSVSHARALSRLIKGSVVVTADTPVEERRQIIKDFESGKIKCVINCMIFTEGTDIPMVETIIIARPTENESLYTQMVGRGTRTYPGKKYLTLIDCVGFTGKHKLCTSASLLGLDPSDLPKSKRKKLQGVMLSEMDDTINGLADGPEIWILQTNEVDLFAEEHHVDLKGIHWRLMPDKCLVCDLGDSQRMFITPMDELGNCSIIYKRGIYIEQSPKLKYQEALDKASEVIRKSFQDGRGLWDKERVAKWSNEPSTERQRNYAQILMADPKNIAKYGEIKLDLTNLTKGQVGAIIDHLKKTEKKDGVDDSQTNVLGYKRWLPSAKKYVDVSKFTFKASPKQPIEENIRIIPEGKTKDPYAKKKTSSASSTGTYGRRSTSYKNNSSKKRYY